MQVPRAAVVSFASHRSRGVPRAATGLGSVAFEFDRLRARFFAVRSERERCVAYPGAGVPAYGQTYGRLEGLLAFASPASPRVALAASLQAARQTALAKKCARIAGRLACLAARRRRFPVA